MRRADAGAGAHAGGRRTNAGGRRDDTRTRGVARRQAAGGMHADMRTEAAAGGRRRRAGDGTRTRGVRTEDNGARDEKVLMTRKY